MISRPAPRTLAHPRADAPDQPPRPARVRAIRLFIRRLLCLVRQLAAKAQTPHARAPHQLRHAVEDDDGALSRLVAREQRQQARGVLAVGHVYDEDDLGRSEVALNIHPRAFVERRAEVVRSDAQAQSITLLDLALRLFERREQT